MPKRILPHWVLSKITLSNNFMEIQMGWGGGSLNLEILSGGGLKQFWKSRWMGGGGQKTVPSVVEAWIFSGITHLWSQVGICTLKPEKTANIWQCYHWFPSQMTSEKRVQKFPTYDITQIWLVLLIGHGAWEIPRSGVVTHHRYRISVLVLRRHWQGNQ